MYVFSFSFSEVSSVKYHSQSHWLNWKGMSSAAKLPPPYLFLDFQFAAQELSGSLPYKDIRCIESRGIQSIHAKQLTHNPNTQSCVRYTLLVMNS